LAKEFFAENNLPYEEFNVAADPTKRSEMIEKSGQMGVPVIEIDDQVIVGFDKELIAKKIKKV
jgi:glutaredoxin